MNTTTPTTPPLFHSTASFKKFTPAQYHRLADAGILLEGEPVELLEGYLVEKPVKNPPHEASMRRVTARLARILPAGFFMQIQGATALGESEPEPDASIIRGDETTCDGRIPTPADLALVLEVSDSSLSFDRGHKGRIYSAAGLAVYWIVNVDDRQVEVYTDPQPAANPPAYATRTDYPHGGTVPVVLDGVTVATLAVADLIP